MLPRVDITKADGQTGVVRPSVDGVLAVIGPSEKGALNIATSHSDIQLAFAEFGWGVLVEGAAYDLPIAAVPVVLVRGDPSIVGEYWTLTTTGGGSSAATADTSSEPLDDFKARIRFIAGGTIGVDGITYQESLDDGETYGKIKQLGTATSITIPDSDVKIDFGAGTILAAEEVAVQTLGPRLTNADLTDSLEALRISSLQWDALLVVGLDADDATVALVDAWLRAREEDGRYKTAVLNFRVRSLSGVSESEAAYLTAFDTEFDDSSSLSIVVGADQGDIVSPLRGIKQNRPTSLFVAARGMGIDIAEDPAYVATGPLDGVTIKTDLGSPLYHDERLSPGLDDVRATTLRTFERRGGIFITNANLLSPTNSDFVYWQHARVMNRACDITQQVLETQCSIGIHVQKDPNNPAKRVITEADARKLERLVQTALEAQLGPSRVSSATFVLKRDDDLSSNAGATLTGTLAIGALRYVKVFAVKAQFI